MLVSQHETHVKMHVVLLHIYIWSPPHMDLPFYIFLDMHTCTSNMCMHIKHLSYSVLAPHVSIHIVLNKTSICLRRIPECGMWNVLSLQTS